MEEKKSFNLNVCQMFSLTFLHVEFVVDWYDVWFVADRCGQWTRLVVLSVRGSVGEQDLPHPRVLVHLFSCMFQQPQQ